MAQSEARMHLMVELGELQVGFPDVEQFCLELEKKYRATAAGDLREKGSKSKLASGEGGHEAQDV